MYKMNEILNSMEPGDYISLVACIISIVAAGLSFISYRLSKREYALQVKIYSDGLANFNFKVIDSCLKDNNDCDKIQYWFHLVVTNLSDKQTSIIEYSLKLECLTKIVYKPEYILPSNIKNSDITLLEMPQNIEPHSSLKGWCVFELPRSNFKELEIETYSIVLKDIHQKTCSQNPIYIKEELINYDI